MAGEDLFPAQSQDTGDSLFSGEPTTPVSEDKSFLEELVGEGRKYADAEALAKSRIHADNHISQLEKDNEELRQELLKRQGMEEFYERLKNARSEPEPTTPEPTSEGERQTGQPNEISQDYVRSLVNEAVSEFVSAEQQNRNKDYVMGELEKRMGPGYQAKMRERAAQLGESTQDLSEMAMKKPQVFLELMAPQVSAPQSEPTNPHTQVNSGHGVPTPGVRNNKYYEQLKAKDPKAYFSKETRVQMMNDALKLGEAFYQ